MKKFLVLMSLMALATMTMTSCLRVNIGEKGWSLDGKHHNDTPTQVNNVNQVTTMQAFDDVSVSGPFNVILEQGQGHTVRVDGTTQQLEKMTIYVKDGGLVIDQRDSKWSSNDFKGMRIFVTTPTINDIEMAGSGSITAPNALSGADMDLEVAGSGEITIAQLTCQNLNSEVAGSGAITLGPIQATTVKNEIAGSGNIDIAALVCTKVNNEIAGSGNIVCNNLNVDNIQSDIAGSGNVYLRGTASSHDEDIAGSGKVDTKGLTSKK